MAMDTPRWVLDLQSMVDAVPFGTVTPVIIRHRNTTTQVKVNAAETIKYDDTAKAIEDVTKLISNLLNAKYTGEVSFKLIMKDGDIVRVAYYNERETNYAELNKQHGKNSSTPEQQS